MKAVYVETTIVSYLVARPSRDLIVAAHQELPREWWDTERGKYTLVVSPVVLAEAEAGDADAARRRLDALTGCEVLRGCSEIDALADRIQAALAIPEAKKLVVEKRGGLPCGRTPSLRKCGLFERKSIGNGKRRLAGLPGDSARSSSDGRGRRCRRPFTPNGGRLTLPWRPSPKGRRST
jgi:hypothetical protein